MTQSLIRAKQPVVASEYRFGNAKTGERAVASNGELNAISKKDLLMRSRDLQMATASSAVISNDDYTAANRQREIARNRDLMVRAASNPEALRVLGEKMADEIYMTTNRKGFSRRFLNRVELKQGEIPRFPVRSKNVTAMWLAGPDRLETQIATDKWLTPPEGQLGVRVFVPQNEINQSNSDVLEEKYVEGLEGIMVSEDRLWYNMVQNTVGIDNDQTIIAGTLSPSSLMGVRQQVARWGLKSAYCLMASDLFVDIVGDSSFIQAIEPVARHELIMTGELAILYGMTLISEAYRHPEHKVLGEGEFVIVSDPLTHGAYSDRGGVDSQPLDPVSENIIGRGWLLSESFTLAVANTRSTAIGRRV